MPEEIILCVDPGRDKYGLAVVGRESGVFYKTIAGTAVLCETAGRLIDKYGAGAIILGDRTFSDDAQKALSRLNPADSSLALPIILVDEHRSSEEARKRYWRENPPQGWRRLLPVTMQTPPAPIDDYVAVILAERYFTRTNPVSNSAD